MLPTGGVEDRALEVVEPRPVRITRDVEEPDRAHEHVTLIRAPVVEANRPHVAIVVPGGRLHGDAEFQVRAETELVDRLLEVLLQLRLLRVGARPVVGLEREAVEMRPDVDLGAGVRVVPPGPADTEGRLVDRERVDACPPQLHANRDPAEPGTDDDHPRRPSRTEQLLVGGLHGHSAPRPVARRHPAGIVTRTSHPRGKRWIRRRASTPALPVIKIGRGFVALQENWDLLAGAPVANRAMPAGHVIWTWPGLDEVVLGAGEPLQTSSGHNERQRAVSGGSGARSASQARNASSILVPAPRNSLVERGRANRFSRPVVCAWRGAQVVHIADATHLKVVPSHRPAIVAHFGSRH